MHQDSNLSMLSPGLLAEVMGEQSMRNFQFKKFRLQKLNGTLKEHL